MCIIQFIVDIGFYVSYGLCHVNKIKYLCENHDNANGEK